MEKFNETPRWIRFALGLLLAAVLLFGMVFEISIPMPGYDAPEPPQTYGEYGQSEYVDPGLVESFAVRERIGIDSRVDSYLYNGADLYIYSDDHSTQKLHLDGATGGLDMEGVLDVPVGTEHIGVPSAISADIVTSTLTGTVTTIADGEVWFVHSVFVNVTTSFDCTGDDCTLTVGDGNDADGFLTLADASLQSTFTEATGFAAGWAGIENGSAGAYTLDDGGPFVYAPSGAAETIDYEIGGTDPAAGAATIYVIYTRIQ
jgi:hypothetical protein